MAELFLVEFKGHRREYCSNVYHHKFRRGMAVITEAESGESLGHVLHRWEKDSKPKQKKSPQKILRGATEAELQTHSELRPREIAAKAQARAVAKRLGLTMKLSDVEIQFDGSKMIFYYTAEGRVDFRVMVKELAANFRTWIEMRQISPREESRRLGDCGLCGGEVCCRRAGQTNIQVGAQDARDQDLQMNMSKLTGLCGKLRCCLSFEKSVYLDVKRLFPGRGAKVETPAGPGTIKRIDIFNEEAVVSLGDGTEVRVGPDQVRRQSRASRLAGKAPQDEEVTKGTEGAEGAEVSPNESQSDDDTTITTEIEVSGSLVESEDYDNDSDKPPSNSAESNPADGS